MRNVFRGALLATALTPCAAWAQDEVAPQERASANSNPREIIVTARKREETLQSVPTTVAVATSETIERLNLNNLQDIAQTTPGLVFDDSFGRDGNRPVIRGQANILGESGVAFFIDGIYYTGSLADYDVDTIDRIEIVKGPQSALYGRNTYSGAINIISKLPGDTWEGRISADIAQHDRYELTAGIRGPISDGLSLGINGRFYDFGGEFTNQFDGNKVGKQSSWSASGVLRWDDGGPFTATLRGYYNRTDDGQPAIFAQGAGQNNCLFDNGALYAGGGRYFCGIIAPGQINTDYARQFADPSDVGIEADTYNVSLRMEYELSDQLTLVSLTGYNDRTQTILTDGDYGPNSFQTAVFARFPAGAPIGFGPAGPIFPFGFVGTTVDFSFANRNETQDWSQELKLVYESDAFDFILGGYYFDQSDDNFSIRDVPADAAARAGASFGARLANEIARCNANPNCGRVAPFFGPSTPNARDENLLDIENIAAFAAINWHITPEINLGLEGRYSEEKISQVAFDFNEGQARPAPVTASRTFKEFTPRVTFDWQLSPDNLLYAIYAEGQKPGGFNGPLAIAAGVPSFDAEENASYELGFKNSFADGRVIFNLAAFLTDIEGYQLTQNVSVPPNQVSVITNAGNAEIIGLEAELVGELSRGLTLTANYAFANSEFTSGFDENQGVLNDVADDGLVNCSTGDQFADVAGCQSLFGSIKGKSIPRAPRHRIFADLDYRSATDIGGGDWDFFAGGNITFTSTSFAQVHNLAETGSAIEVDARMGIENDRFRVQLYVNNLFDEDAVQQIIRYADADLDFRRSFIAGLRPGRRFGVVLSTGF
ncbi:TonB-dependent receptor [Erythrobacter sp. JK5]|uniref:TonB-dependent receptor n=1 Tax=Erythrobacter sp. JK5 TaxID=2829500 RepID=UPI001BA6C332|nr:TonB-dependent receptor [Erythrobacter sp. JK5]QUL36973.1 TonB-dependent receptor [Erythrobacter sp. JK5]